MKLSDWVDREFSEWMSGDRNVDRNGIVMWRIQNFSIREIVPASILSGVFASGICMLTNVSPASHTIRVGNLIDRTAKGDRLQVTPIARKSETNSTSTYAPRPRVLAPIGCEPAFSPAVNEGIRPIFRRCIS